MSQRPLFLPLSKSSPVSFNLSQRVFKFAANYLLLPDRSVSIFRALLRKPRNIMRRPKGIKTKKSVAKRFKLTANGKALFHRAGRRHLNQTKSRKRRRSLGKAATVHPTDLYRITQCLPFTR